MDEVQKYKKGLRWALAVIVLLFIIVVINVAVPRDRMAYDQGYVDGWNGCVEAQTELMRSMGRPVINLTLPVEQGESLDEPGEQIGIIS